MFDLFCSYDLDLDPMTFIYELDPYSLDIYWMFKYELRYVKAFGSYCLTDRQPKAYTTPQRGWSTKAITVIKADDVVA